MYASNEDEEWIYLHKTPPMNAILRNAVNLIDDQRSTSSSSSSDSSSSSSKSGRSLSLSSISSAEFEHAQNDDADVSLPSADNSVEHQNLNYENQLLETVNIKETVLFSRDHTTQTELIDNLSLQHEQQLISAPLEKQKEVIVVSELIDPHDIDNSTTKPITINVNDTLNTGFESSKTLPLTNSKSITSESFSLPNGLRCRRVCDERQGTDLSISGMVPSTLISQDIKRPKRRQRSFTKNDKLIGYIVIVVLFISPILLGQILTSWDRPVMDKIMNALNKTNQRLDEWTDLPVGNIDEKLTKQLEEKVQNMIKEHFAWHAHEKYAFILQINELRELANATQLSLTKTIDDLANENERLQKRIKSLEDHAGEQHTADMKTCSEGGNCTYPSRSALKKLVKNLFKKTTSIATDTSVKFSGLFEHMSASVSDIVDQRHDYVEKSKRKLTGLANSSTAEKMQRTVRRSMDNISSSFRKAKSTCATWLKSRAERREQNRMKNTETQNRQTSKRYPWRWSFDRVQERQRHQEHACHSKFYFPINKICSMKNWMAKIFRS